MLFRHIITLIEGWIDETGMEGFYKEFHGKVYPNGAKVRVREIRLFDIGVNEKGRESLLADLKSLGAFNSGGGDGGFKWSKLSGWLRKISFIFGIKKIDDSKIVPSGFQNKWNCHYLAIGEVKDPVDNNGVEQV